MTTETYPCTLAVSDGDVTYEFSYSPNDIPELFIYHYRKNTTIASYKFQRVTLGTTSPCSQQLLDIFNQYTESQRKLYEQLSHDVSDFLDENYDKMISSKNLCLPLNKLDDLNDTKPTLGTSPRETEE